MLALYTLVRSGKIVLDIKESQGKVTKDQINNGLLILGIVMSITFSTMYLMDWDFWSEAKWQALTFIFRFNNKPNDRIFRDIIRAKCKL